MGRSPLRHSRYKISDVGMDEDGIRIGRGRLFTMGTVLADGFKVGDGDRRRGRYGRYGRCHADAAV